MMRSILDTTKARGHANSSASSTTGGGGERVGSDAGGFEAHVAQLPAGLREAMRQVALKATSATEALAPMIELLVPDDPFKQAAIVQAFSTNTPLREQWERTFQILRGTS